MGKPRKVFVSVLGTGFYEKCRYAESEPTRFIQKATLEWLKANEWTENDRVLIFTTNLAKEKNWSFRGRKAKFQGTSEEEYVGLQYVLDDMHLAAKVEAVDIPDGKNESEMWEVFGRIYDKLEEQDQLYFDLTHAFRYLPMLVLVLGQYARHLKKVTIKSVTYGNYEGRDKDIAPITNLMPLVTLQDYTQAAANFEEYGIVSKLMFSQKSALFDNLGKQLKRFEQDLATCSGKSLMEGEAVESAKESLSELIESDKVVKPVQELLRKIYERVKPFERGNHRLNLRNCVKWYENYSMVQQAFTLCQESLVTLVCEQLENPLSGDAVRSPQRQLRDVVSAVLGVSEEIAADESKWRGDLLLDKDFSRMLLSKDYIVKIRAKYNNLSSKRNALNHAGFGDNVKTSVEIINDLRGFTSKYFDLLIGDTQKLLINLSNHPYASWSEEQRKAAEVYGQCEDMKFPQVEPDIETTDLEALVADYERWILERAKTADVTVHVMGEMTFCFALIQRLLLHGISCIASCTRREVVELNDHTRQTTFQFGGFRQYFG